ncbi:hypothetical protein IQ268_28240 [Oculatella sp. LEGE 06141]|uniref:hypothetical protein n=1 Tax=Oculatella sp. LEGE 06141 TaxID=1828648 RepID=UPI0018819B40|nr:hypothetical protein [Oculatella sp. LEGE 06141]MBE9182443.1 hypothetical protein [Oculatella sp. LEGE 06141]
MGKLSRRKAIGFSPRANSARGVPSDGQICLWLNDPDLINWIALKWKVLGKELIIQKYLDLLRDKVLSDKNHDWRVGNPSTPQFTVGINAETWTLWISCCNRRVFALPDWHKSPFDFKAPLVPYAVMR